MSWRPAIRMVMWNPKYFQMITIMMTQRVSCGLPSRMGAGADGEMK